MLDQPGVLLTGDATRAFALARVVADEVEILALATDPDHCGQGHGRACLDAALAQAAARGARHAFLEVAADNAAALALYRAAGFVQAGLRRGYYARPGAAADALVMTRALP